MKSIQSFFRTDPFAQWFIGVFIFLSFVFLAHYWIVGQAVYGDGIYYYSYTRSMVKDGDVQLVNEYAHTYSPDNNNSLTPLPDVPVANTTPNGHAQNKYGIGAPIFWILPFGLIDLVVGLWNLVSLPIADQGYSDIFQIGVGLFNVFASSVACVVLYLFLKYSFSQKVAFWSVLTMLFGSNLFYYSSLDVVNSHPFSFLFSTIFLFYWWKTFGKRSATGWFVLGILQGILMLIRTQDCVFFVLPLSEVVYTLWKTKRFVLSKQIILKTILFGIGVIVAFSPQLFAWQTIYGDFLTSPYIRSGEGFNFLNLHLIGLFLSTKIGIAIWTPLVLVGLLGLMLFARKRHVLGTISLLYVLSQIIFISAWSGWTQGEAFGVRMLISSYPFLAIGLGYVIQILLKRLALQKILIICGLFVVYNFCLILYFLLIAQSPTHDGKVVTQDRSLQKIEQLLHLK